MLLRVLGEALDESIHDANPGDGVRVLPAPAILKSAEAFSQQRLRPM